MGKNAIETIMGTVVLLVAGLFLAFAYSRVDLRPAQGYELKADFASAGGLEMGSDVRINGIKVGTVVGQRLDNKTFEAVVVMSIDPAIELPADSVAAIASEGLMGGMYVRLEPGKAAQMLASGGTIENTRDYKSLEELVGEIIFTATGGAGQGQ